MSSAKLCALCRSKVVDYNGPSFLQGSRMNVAKSNKAAKKKVRGNEDDNDDDDDNW